MRRIDNEEIRPTSGTDLSEYGRVLWRKRYYILVPLILAGIIAVIGVQFLKPVYKSSSLIRLDDPGQITEELAQFVSREEQRQAVDEDNLERIRAEIRASGFVDRVIAHLGLDENPEMIRRAERTRNARYPNVSVDEVLQRNLREVLTSKIRVTLDGPGMFEIACHDYDARTCYLLADAVTTLFIDAQRQRQLRGLEEAGEFSDEQLEVYRQRMEESELELQRILDRITQVALQSNPVGETSVRYQEEFGGESNLRYAETIEEQMDIAISELDAIISRTRTRIAELIGSPPRSFDSIRGSELSKLTNSLTAHLQTELRLSLGARGVTTADLEANQARVRDTEKALERHLTQLVDSRYGDVSVDYRPLIVEYYLQTAMIRSLRAKRDQLTSYIGSFKRKLDLVPQLEAEKARLEERVRTDRELYNSFLRAKTSTQIGQAVQNTNLALTVEVLEPAAVPLVPVAPNKRKILMLALIIGATLGVGGVILSEYTDTSFRTIEQIEQSLDLRVLGTVPLIDNSAPWNRKELGRQAAIWGGTVFAVVVLALAGFYLYGRMADRIVVSGGTGPSYQSISPAGATAPDTAIVGAEESDGQQ